MINDIKWGRLDPTVEKRAQNNQYSILTLGVPEVKELEVLLPYPNDDMIDFMNQGRNGSCTGNSATWATVINNYPDEGKVYYDWLWLYRRGQEIDGDPKSGYDENGRYHEGGYVWAVHDVLRKEGHRKLDSGVALPPNIDEGIESYYWCNSIEELKIAFSLGRCPVAGTLWTKRMKDTKNKYGESWAEESFFFPKIEGGHAYCLRGISTSREAVLIRNSWGRYWGDSDGEAWLSFKTLERLLKLGGELVVGIDRKTLKQIGVE